VGPFCPRHFARSVLAKPPVRREWNSRRLILKVAASAGRAPL
jgi:hypothetical protein